jgi:hypothetical protein
MIFGYFTLFVALVISAVAAYYSIVGLTAIFSAAVIPILIMGASLEVGKVTAAVWLKVNWHRASLLYKFYLVPAVAFLMLLTSMGIFGFLSKAHSDQSLVSGDSMAKVAIYDEKIKTSKDNIDANRKALKQMDESVDQSMVRSNDEKGADKAVALRRSQAKERTRLQQEIATEQKAIGALNDEAAPLRAEFRKVESEVGPIKYIAALVYGDNPDTSVLEKAVRLVIIIIVAVFDPLALVLILAAQQSIRWATEEKEKTWIDEQAEELNEAFNTPDPYVPDVGEKPTAEELKEPEKTLAESHPYLFTPFSHFSNTTPIVYKPEPVYEADDGPLTEEQVTQIQKIASEDLPTDNVIAVSTLFDEPVPEVPKSNPETRQPYKAQALAVPETKHVEKRPSAIQADNMEGNETASGFGTNFPPSANKGDTFLRVDYLPNKLFKFNGSKWIEVDKTNSDAYAYDEQYILFLIEKLKSGEYDLDQLSTSEQELVAEKLQQIANEKT